MSESGTARKLDHAAERRRLILEEMARPETARDPARMTELAQESASLQQAAAAAQTRDALVQEHAALLAEQNREEQNRDQDPEMTQLIQEEIQRTEQEILEIDRNFEHRNFEHRNVDRQFQQEPASPDPDGAKGCILEIRSGAGGREAGIFAQELLRMYLRFTQQMGWDTDLTETHSPQPPGISQAVLEVRDPEAFRVLQNESGTHRVQRVPETEAQGRIHTSTATIAVLPLASQAQIKINPQDLRIETMRGGGPGGQAINKLATRVRVVHLPTGITVTCQDERSLKRNRGRAMEVLASRLLHMERERLRQEQDGLRRSQVGTGDRSLKVRTYNHPHDRVTDHRLGRSFRPIQRIMDGDLLEITREITRELGREKE